MSICLSSRSYFRSHSTTEVVESPLVIGMCNPLLDISADVPVSFFEK
jgi:hypothetical protein